MIDYFEGRMTIDLVLGREYDVLDGCGMLSFDAEYLGVAQRAHYDTLLVFRMPKEKSYRYCGGYIRADLPLSTKRPITVYIQISHYGHSIATLRQSGSREDDKWEIKE